jgi:hypothetical protein
MVHGHDRSLTVAVLWAVPRRGRVADATAL